MTSISAQRIDQQAKTDLVKFYFKLENASENKDFSIIFEETVLII